MILVLVLVGGFGTRGGGEDHHVALRHIVLGLDGHTATGQQHLILARGTAEAGIDETYYRAGLDGVQSLVEAVEAVAGAEQSDFTVDGEQVGALCPLVGEGVASVVENDIELAVVGVRGQFHILHAGKDIRCGGILI